MSFSRYISNLEKRQFKANKIFESTSKGPKEINENIINYLNNEFNTTFKFVKVGIYKNESFGTIDGSLYISDNKSAFRINWLDKNLIGISYWITYNPNYIDYEFEFNGEDSEKDLKENLPAIVSYLKNSLETEEDVEVKTGKFEVYSYTNENEIIVDKYDCESLINDIFDNKSEMCKESNLKSMVKSIGKKLNHSLLILGADKNSGTQKKVQSILDSNGLNVGENYIVRSCINDNSELLTLLHDNSNKILIFTNADNMLLKSDDVSNTTRQLLLPNITKKFTYTTEKDGNKNTEDFTFTGGIILITNVTKNRLRNKDFEIVSKCMSLNLKSNDEDITTKVKNIINDIHIFKSSSVGSEAKEVKDKETLEDVVDFLLSNDFIYSPRNKDNSFTFEQLQNVFLIAKSNNKNWKFIALDML